MNPEYIDRDRTRSKALVGNLTGKHVVGSLGGVATTIAVPNTMRLRSWSDVMASGAVTIGGRIAVKQMDEGAGDTFMLTRLDIISREISPATRANSIKHYPTKKYIRLKRFLQKTSIRK